MVTALSIIIPPIIVLLDGISFSSNMARIIPYKGSRHIINPMVLADNNFKLLANRLKDNAVQKIPKTGIRI